ncbi:MFS domain-containing protein [Caenorhabditis elegans]|nr:MFS domain-containing protein [Caenorhabditis elegans]CDM63586.1 MFS domain-containing protein [Caenorhabditis elegans]|eukprot:NP_001293446.1 Uncharacterized protein CELE_Y71G12B.25 [Caenorhabditis elegans]
MFFGPIVGSKVAAWTSLRTSQFIVGFVLAGTMIPVVMFLLPTTHSIPRLASARLRPQDYWHMISKNSALKEGLLIRALLISAYVCYEMISRNFLLRNFMHNTNESAYVLLTMSASLLAVQFIVMPIVQRTASPKRLLQVSLVALFGSYLAAAFANSFEQMLMITAVQTAAYAVAYAESSTQITTAVELTDLGKATGLASMVQWLTHFILPIYASQLVEHLHYTFAFYTSALLSVFLFAYISVYGKETPNRSGTLLPSLSATNY